MGVALLPFLFLIVAMVRYGFNYPFVDDWHMVQLVAKTQSGEITFAELWQAYNGHRLFFWHIIMLPLAAATDWNHGYEVALNIVIGLGIFGTVLWTVRRVCVVAGAAFPIALVPVLALLIFSLNQWCNWAWGRQLLVFLTVLYALVGFVIMASPRPRVTRTLVAGILGFMATFTFASGLVYWPCVLAMLLMPILYREAIAWRSIGLWIFMWSVTLFLYFWDFNADRTLAHAVPEGQASFHIPPLLDMGLYTLTYLGASLSYFSGWGLSFRTGLGMALGTVGILFIVVAIALLSRRRLPMAALAPLTAYALYALGSGLLTAIGRAGVGGINQAGAQRYYTVSIPFWIALVILLYLLVHDSSVWKRRAAGLAFACIAGLSILTTRQGWYTLDEHQRIWTAEVRRMMVEELDEVPPRLKYPIERSLSDDLRTLRDRKLSIYRPNAATYWLGEP